MVLPELLHSGHLARSRTLLSGPTKCLLASFVPYRKTDHVDAEKEANDAIDAVVRASSLQAKATEKRRARRENIRRWFPRLGWVVALIIALGVVALAVHLGSRLVGHTFDLWPGRTVDPIRTR